MTRHLQIFLALLLLSPQAARADSLFKGGLFDIDDTPPVRSAPEVVRTAEPVRQKQYRFDSEDQYLFSQMQKVSDWLNNYIVMNHRFPEQVIGGEDAWKLTSGQGDELTYALQQLNQLVPNNPYRAAGGARTIYNQPGADVDPVLQEQNGSPTIVEPQDSLLGRNRIKVYYDQTLNSAAIDDLAVHPPQEWNNAPGTIGIATDRLYQFVVFGTGVDGKPIRDPASGNARLVLGNYCTWDQPPLAP